MARVPAFQAGYAGSIPVTRSLNGAGASGWEMISYESVPLTGAFTNNVKGYAYLLFFKRPKQ
jgi:hypothetical protein